MSTVARLIPYAVAALVCALPMVALGYREVGVVGTAISIGVLLGVWVSLYTADKWELDYSGWLRSPLEHLKHMASSVPLALVLAVLFVPIGGVVGFVIGLLTRNLMRVAGYDV